MIFGKPDSGWLSLGGRGRSLVRLVFGRAWGSGLIVEYVALTENKKNSSHPAPLSSKCKVPSRN